MIMYMAVSKGLGGLVVSEEPLLLSFDSLDEPVELASGEGLLGLDHGYEKVFYQVSSFWALPAAISCLFGYVFP